MKRKVKLALDELERSLELINQDNQMQVLGGNGLTGSLPSSTKEKDIMAVGDQSFYLDSDGNWNQSLSLSSSVSSSLDNSSYAPINLFASSSSFSGYNSGYSGSSGYTYWGGEIEEVVVTRSGYSSGSSGYYGSGYSGYYSSGYYGSGSSGSNLTPEDRWALSNPVEAAKALINRRTAEAVSGNFPGLHNGYADALRHALWTALNTASFGKNKAIELGIAHELSDTIVDREYAMDIHNNQWGANYAQNKSSININTFINDFNDAIKSNRIIIIDNSNGIPPVPFALNTGGY